MGLGDFWATVIAILVVAAIIYFPIVRPLVRHFREKKEHREQIERDKKKVELLEKMVQNNDDDKKD